MNKEKLSEFIEKELGTQANETILEKFSTYESLLIEWNRRFNLTAIKEEDDVLVKHFIDSIYPLKFVHFKEGESLIDIGSGAGFPGLCLAIMCPGLKISLVESTGKKVSFMNEVKDKLHLDNVTLLETRAESLNKYKEQFDYASARAVSQLNVLLELTIPLLKVNGHFLAYKGSMVDMEIKQAKRALHILSAEIEEKYTYNLPYINDGRSFLVIRKRKATEHKYPRSYSLIKNKPL